MRKCYERRENYNFFVTKVDTNITELVVLEEYRHGGVRILDVQRLYNMTD